MLRCAALLQNRQGRQTATHSTPQIWTVQDAAGTQTRGRLGSTCLPLCLPSGVARLTWMKCDSECSRCCWQWDKSSSMLMQCLSLSPQCPRWQQKELLSWHHCITGAPKVHRSRFSTENSYKVFEPFWSYGQAVRAEQCSVEFHLCITAHLWFLLYC